MITLKDPLGNEITLRHPAKRIVSLVPSQTELLFDLGLDEEVVGITKFCIHPESWFRSKFRVGGTKDFKIDKIKSLQPDLILANKEENIKDTLNILQQEFPVYVSDIHNLEDSFQMIQDVGLLCGKKSESHAITNEIREGFSSMPLSTRKLKVLYLIWRNPWMAAGNDTFISDMLDRCGFENACKDERYPQLDENKLAVLNPDLIFLSSEPYPFKEIHIKELQAIAPHSKIMLVDGEMFSWYGSRLRYSPLYFQEKIIQATNLYF